MTENVEKRPRVWPKYIREFSLVLAVAVIIYGIVLRFWQIAQNDFVFYDEGYYLNFNRNFGQFVSNYHPRNLADLGQLFFTHLRVSLGTGKALWFFLSDLRIFFNSQQLWSIPRILSAIFGVMTLGLVYLFGRRLYDKKTALLATVIFAVLPSHVFYSRLALQESLSTFVVLLAFYLYTFSRFGVKTIFSGLCFALGYFSNYRLTVLPIFIILGEAWMAFAERRGFDFRKCLWCVLVFFIGVFLVGAIDNGLNTRVVFSWIFHQSQLAAEQVKWFNFFSYPYYLFRLDNPVLALLFFGNIVLLVNGARRELMPFVVAIGYMFLFSWAGDKGARYLCVMLPFVVLSVAYCLNAVWEKLGSVERRTWLAGLILLMFAGLLGKSTALAGSTSDYRVATKYILERDSDAKFLSTQSYVQGIFLADPKRTISPPRDYTRLLQYYRSGFRYLVLCPQAFISWSAADVRFSPELEGYLGFILRQEKPFKVFSNFSLVLLERFVFEHNQDLGRSIAFLKVAAQQQLGAIRIYDLRQVTSDILARTRDVKIRQEN